MRTDTPVLILNCKLGGLAIFRSLGMRGIECWGIDDNPRSAGFLSRYSRGRRVVGGYDASDPGPYLELVLRTAARIGRRAILIPTSDELVHFVARYRDPLAAHFDYPRQSPDLIRRLISKVEMNHLASAHGVPVPRTYLPRDEEDLLRALRDFQFPAMLKPCYGSGQDADPRQTMVVVHDTDQLLREYRRRENPQSPNMMIQEYVPGDDDQVYIFDGYFDADSNCLAAFTGRKIRQHPIHRGCAAMGEQRSNDEVARHMIRFLRGIGYQGVVDAGLRYDARDGRYKLLDVNPRVGQAFRLFLAEDGTDVVQCMYRDLTRQSVGELHQREGRRWAIEDFDLSSLVDYRREGSLTLLRWLASYRGVEETAWWSARDPWPSLIAGARTARRAGRFLGRRLVPRRTAGRSASSRRAPVTSRAVTRRG